MIARTLPAAARAAAVGATVLIAAVWSAGAAFALGEVAASPPAVVPGGTVTVDGHCPAPVAATYVRATVGIDSIGRYVVVPVQNGAFSAKFRARGVDGFKDPHPGDHLRAQVSCATAASYVANVGTVKVKVVDDVLGVANASGTKHAASASTSKSRETTAAADTGSSAPISPWIPITAFAIAAFGTFGAYALSRRSDRRNAAMSAHPAQRGLGLPPRRDAR